jgi:2-pyrone-4,6-dicarboxylate lactonase
MLRRKFLMGAASFGAISALGGNPSHGAEDSTVPTRSIPEIAGPDKNTKTPAFKVPAGVIDTPEPAVQQELPVDNPVRLFKF